MRIVSLVPSITEALCQLGAADDLVGVTDYCLHPADVVRTRVRIGGTKDPDLDRIWALQPDLVIANTDEQRATTLAVLDDAPCDVLVTATDDLDQVADTWTQLGVATGRTAAADRERARLDAARAAAREQVAGLAPLATLVPVWRAPWMAAGGGTYVGDLLAHCGFTNMLGGAPGKWVRFEPTTDPQAAAAKAETRGPFADQKVHAVPRTPEAVLLPTEPYAFDETHRDTFVALGCPAASVRIVDGELLTWWLSRTVPALETFAALRRAWPH